MKNALRDLRWPTDPRTQSPLRRPLRVRDYQIKTGVAWRGGRSTCPDKRVVCGGHGRGGRSWEKDRHARAARHRCDAGGGERGWGAAARGGGRGDGRGSRDGVIYSTARVTHTQPRGFTAGSDGARVPSEWEARTTSGRPWHSTDTGSATLARANPSLPLAWPPEGRRRCLAHANVALPIARTLSPRPAPAQEYSRIFTLIKTNVENTTPVSSPRPGQSEGRIQFGGLKA